MNKLQVLVFNEKQLNIAFSCLNKQISKIYADSSLFVKNKSLDIPNESYSSVYLAAPYILREKDKEDLKNILLEKKFGGILVRNLETLAFLNENEFFWPNLRIDLDSSMYTLNNQALKFYINESKLEVEEVFYSYELNAHEMKDLNFDFDNDINNGMVVYGRIPMMVSANCVRKTTDKCTGELSFINLKDRTGANQVVYTDCKHCYNVIFNAIPLSLHKYVKFNGKTNYRLDFTDESSDLTQKVIDYFYSLFTIYNEPFYKDFTTGHIKRGVE